MGSTCSERRFINIGTTLTFLCLISINFKTTHAFSIRDLVKGDKRASKGADVPCPPWHPFRCPKSGDCIPFKYVCDGSIDCADSYDEDVSLCTAAARPPPEETAAFLTALMSAHGPDFFVRLMGNKAKNALAEMGGTDKVSVTISQSPTIAIFGEEMKMSNEDIERMRSILQSIVLGLPNENFSDNEGADFRFFAEKLHSTGFF